MYLAGTLEQVREPQIESQESVSHWTYCSWIGGIYKHITSTSLSSSDKLLDVYFVLQWPFNEPSVVFVIQLEDCVGQDRPAHIRRIDARNLLDHKCIIIIHISRD